MHFVRAPDGLSAGLGQHEVTHLALLDELFHCPDGVFDRHCGIDAMHAVEIDGIHTQPLERLVARQHDVVRMSSAETGRRGNARQRKIAELRADQEFVALALDRPRDQFFVAAVAIGIGGHQQIDAEFECAMNRRDRFSVVGLAVGNRHAHATKAEGGNRGAVTAEFALLHVEFSVC